MLARNFARQIALVMGAIIASCATAFATCPYPPTNLPLIIGATDACEGLFISAGTNGTITNNGSIIGNLYGIGSRGTNITIINNNIIKSTNQTGAGSNGIDIQVGPADLIENSATGTISGYFSGITTNTATITTIRNYGLIESTYEVGIINANPLGNINLIDNKLGGIITGPKGAIWNTQNASIVNISNSGNILGQGREGIENQGSNITTIQNSTTGVINGRGGIGNSAGSGISIIQNDGKISGLVGATSLEGIYNAGNISNTLNNTGTIEGNKAIYNTGIGNINTISNTGNITGTLQGIANDTGSIGSISNAVGGSISAPTAIYNSLTSNINSITNNGTIIGTNGYAINNNATITTIGNFGTITGGIRNSNNITTITNILGGVINGGAYAILNETGASISSVVNNGYISSILNLGTINGAGGITNNLSGTINSLTNAQGVGNAAGALQYTGKLPNYYNIVISQSGYGQLIIADVSGKTTFGISTLSTNVAPGTKTNVVRGATAANFTSLSGTFTQGNQKFSFRLNNPNAANDWDLIIDYLGLLGPDLWNTYKALTSNRDALLGAMHQRYAVLNTVMEYDCNRFDKYGVCISFQARSTGWGTQTTGAGVLNIAYRILPKIRVGAYLDYQVAQGTTFGTNYGTGGLQNGFNNPTFGGYVGYTQDKDGTGLQARASGGYNSGKITITRALLENTEAGSGNAALNAYYAFGTFGYGIKIAENSIVAPYSGLLYTNVIRNSYTENYNALVLYPLAYNSFYEQLITGVGGLKLTSMLTDKLGCQFGIGAQFDLKRTANGYGGYSYIPGMEAYGIAHGGSWNGKRPTAQAGAFYNVSKNEQLVINAYAGQQAFTTRTYTSLLAGYQVSF